MKELFDSSDGNYEDSEDNEYTPSDIAELCGEVLPAQECMQIARQVDLEGALTVAFVLLERCGIDPAQFFIDREVLERDDA